VSAAQNRNATMKRPLVALLFCLAGCASMAQPGPGAIPFALIGDLPYNTFEIAALDRLIDEMNEQDLAFVIHVGDITGGRGPCTDAWFEARKRQFQRSKHPFIIVPGDNDWVDCHRSGQDPMDRLSRFRELFESGEESLGQKTIRLERQSSDPRFADYREHMRWVAGNVLFVGLNVQGSNNNLGRTAAMDREVEKRMSAVFGWLDEAVKTVEQKRLSGLVVFIQADPRFGDKPHPSGGFEQFRNVLRTHALWLKKPILLVHGDGHFYIHDRPLRDPATNKPIPNFTRVEVFGSPQVRWIKAFIDPGSPELFRVAPAPSPAPAN
jgi:predicted phosphodiesterase